jgi:hypothetical protein
MAKRLFGVSRLGSALLGLFAACLLLAGFSPRAGAASLEEIKKRGYLIVATEDDFCSHAHSGGHLGCVNLLADDRVLSAEVVHSTFNCA